MKGFYKLQQDENGPYASGGVTFSLLFAENSVSGNCELQKELKDVSQYPVDGWYWLDSVDQAVTFFNLNMIIP
jgi:hypothetical protein